MSDDGGGGSDRVAGGGVFGRVVASLHEVGVIGTVRKVAAAVPRLRARGPQAPAAPHVVTITPPPMANQGSARPFRMHSSAGRDQVVRAIVAGGWSAFEPPLPSVVTELIRRWPTTLLDVGANTGFYSLVAVAAHPDARAIAFEPVPEIAALLRANLHLNPSEARVQVCPVAVTDRSGPVELHLPPPQPDGTIETSTSVEPDFKESIARVVEVVGSTLDHAWVTAGRPQVDVVKVDVEGAEHRVLAGATELVDACRPVFTIEVLPGAKLDELSAFSRRHDYVDVPLTPTAAFVRGAEATVDATAPNHLLVPAERVADVVDTIRHLPGLAVTDDRSPRSPHGSTASEPDP